MELKADSRFGKEDPIQWPQMLSKKYGHYACIQCRPTDFQDPTQPIWWTPTATDFLPSHGSIVSTIGTLADGARKPLISLVRSMSDRVRTFQQSRGDAITHLNFCEMSMRTAIQ